MTDDKPMFTEHSRQMYGWGGGWDRIRRQSECLHCHGTGRCDSHNACGFCEPDEEVQGEGLR